MAAGPGRCGESSRSFSQSRTSLRTGFLLELSSCPNAGVEAQQEGGRQDAGRLRLLPEAGHVRAGPHRQPHQGGGSRRERWTGHHQELRLRDHRRQTAEEASQQQSTQPRPRCKEAKDGGFRRAIDTEQHLQLLMILVLFFLELYSQ
ncbi:hypothetical protein IscW_ISCW017850 [Ixodes scapularis]|uniref:Uncharacterized protein n=1 Tax=Ixodes scapularis TaxID=6945 RepID=B7PI88_IXOSC|nr:hypothetical protein IscW_ISCW017850 [Ixodes scapularis]|eukprot:XP_002404669.1 hypothetical protein IscW_ISCW017850 [Ixodes scapularis]